MGFVPGFGGDLHLIFEGFAPGFGGEFVPGFSGVCTWLWGEFAPGFGGNLHLVLGRFYLVFILFLSGVGEHFAQCFDGRAVTDSSVDEEQV